MIENKCAEIFELPLIKKNTNKSKNTPIKYHLSKRQIAGALLNVKPSNIACITCKNPKNKPPRKKHNNIIAL